jgi:acetyl-CoA acetyltransferase
MSQMSRVAVLGIGVHPFGKFEQKSLDAMCRDALDLALEDAGVDWAQIQAVSAGSSHFSGGLGWGLNGNTVLAGIGETGVPVYNLSAACATGGSAFNVGHLLIASGQYDVVAVVAGEKMPRGFIPRPPGGEDDEADPDYLRWAAIGATNPAYWAIECRRRQHELGTTDQDLAQVAAKAHSLGAHNVNARFRRPMTAEDVLASPLVASPLRLQEICAVSDGAAAVVLGSERQAIRAGRKPVWVAASVVATGQFGDSTLRIPEVSVNSEPGVPRVSEVAAAVERAFAVAGVGPGDIDLLELQDNSVWQELELPELWGFCEPGESDWLVRRGETGVNGRLPINPSGGFLSFGEATTAMGIWQVAELVTQLRGEAGARQVAGARSGLGQTLGLGGNGSAVILNN